MIKNEFTFYSYTFVEFLFEIQFGLKMLLLPSAALVSIVLYSTDTEFMFLIWSFFLCKVKTWVKEKIVMEKTFRCVLFSEKMDTERIGRKFETIASINIEWHVQKSGTLLIHSYFSNRVYSCCSFFILWGFFCSTTTVTLVHRDTILVSSSNHPFLVGWEETSSDYCTKKQILSIIDMIKIPHFMNIIRFFLSIWVKIRKVYSFYFLQYKSSICEIY